MKRVFGFLLVVVLKPSYGEYQQILKSNDFQLVYKYG